MAGLRKILKMFGRMRAGDQMWVWDYAADEPVKEEDMPEGSERWKASEKKRWSDLKEAYEREQKNRSSE